MFFALAEGPSGYTSVVKHAIPITYSPANVTSSGRIEDTIQSKVQHMLNKKYYQTKCRPMVIACG